MNQEAAGTEPSFSIFLPKYLKIFKLFWTWQGTWTSTFPGTLSKAFFASILHISFQSEPFCVCRSSFSRTFSWLLVTTQLSIPFGYPLARGVTLPQLCFWIIALVTALRVLLLEFSMWISFEQYWLNTFSLLMCFKYIGRVVQSLHREDRKPVPKNSIRIH